MEANASIGKDTIDLPANTYILTISGQEEDASLTGDIDILDDLTINGVSAETTIIDGASLDRVLNITGTNDSIVSITNLTIQNGGFDLSSNVADPKGGGIYNALAGATLLISDSIIINNQSFIDIGGDPGGGGIYNAGSLQLSNTDIFTNSSPSGHAIFNIGLAIIKGGNIAFNTAGTAGGGTVLNQGTLHVEGTNIYRNYSYGGAGVNNAYSSTATLENVSIYSNTVYLDGGGILNFGVITVTNSAIYSNHNNTSPGGGISNRGTFLLTSSAVHHNTAKGFAIGGGISIYDGIFDVKNSSVYSNSAGIGGGIYLENGELFLSSSVISGNVADTKGGGIYTLKPVSIENSDISNNVAAEGGGIFVDGAALTVTLSTIQNNQANSAAGIGLYNTSRASMQDSTFSYNSAVTEGGGLFVDSTSTAVLASSTFNHNSATTGAGIYNTGLLNGTNTTVSNNAASSNGGGIWHGGLSVNEVTLTNVTLTENSAPGGSGIYQANLATIIITNTIIANNGVENCNVALTETSYSLEDSNDCGFVGAGDQINTDPLLGPLQNNGGNTQTHALLAASPAVDSATDDICPGTDQRGATRPFDGDGDSTAVCDIGAYEYGGTIWQYLYLPLILKP